MYERLTEGARRALQTANNYARDGHHEYVGTEHIVCGLAADPRSVSSQLLVRCNVGGSQICDAVQKLVTVSSPTGVKMGRLPYTTRAKKIIELAMESARELRHEWVGTQHLLLGCIQEPEGVANQVLTNLGVTAETIRELLLDTTAKQDDETATPQEFQVNIVVTQQIEKPDADCTPAERWERIDRQFHGWFNQGWSQELSRVSAQFFFTIISAVWSGMASKGTAFGLSEPFTGCSGNENGHLLRYYWTGVWATDDRIFTYFTRVGNSKVRRFELPLEYLRDRLRMADIVEMLRDAGDIPVPPSIASELQAAQQAADIDVAAFAESLQTQIDSYLQEKIRPYLKRILEQLRGVYPDLVVCHSAHRDHAMLEFQSQAKGIENTLHGQQMVKIANEVHRRLDRTLDVIK